PPGEQALHLLGDLALERGEIEVAEHFWGMLAPYPSAAKREPAKGAEPFELLYPDPKDNGSLAQAKLILARLFRGEKPNAILGLAAFREKHQAVTGHFAGRDGNLADILQSLIDA